jgi:hypothetical protein
MTINTRLFSPGFDWRHAVNSVEDARIDGLMGTLYPFDTPAHRTRQLNTAVDHNKRSGRKVSIEYRPEKKEIFARCLVDRINEPACYTTTGKRHVKAAWDALCTALDSNPDLTLGGVMTMLGLHHVNYHYWCMMD